MGINVITSGDTLTLNNRVFKDFANTDISTVSFDSDLVAIKTGKNQNTIFAKNETGHNAKVILRLMRGSSDDRFLQGLLAQIEKDFAAFILLSGQFTKRLGDGIGNVVSDAYTLSGGTFTRKVDGKENVEGDTEQGVAVYNMVFAIGKRNIQ